MLTVVGGRFVSETLYFFLMGGSTQVEFALGLPNLLPTFLSRWVEDRVRLVV